MITECPISTSDGVKAADVAWFSTERYDKVRGQVCVTIAPEICVEVVSPSNSRRELQEKRDLYMEAGAAEVWFCLESGEMRFDIGCSVEVQSHICPAFPKALRLD